MSARQLRLFPSFKPLLQRLGQEFFKSVPRKPGVYLMRGEEGRLLYIGQSKNLRIRLATYKNARPGEAPRKTIRLVHQVRSIEWEEQDTAEEAMLLESKLIRKHLPCFNVAQTSPVTWFYFGIKPMRRHQWALRWTARPESEPEEQLHGAFKGRMIGKSYFQALVRLLWAALHRPASIHEFPIPFNRMVYQWVFKCPDRGIPAVARGIGPQIIGNFMNGADRELLDVMEHAFPDAKEDSPDLINQLFWHDLEYLREFFLKGATLLFQHRQEKSLFDSHVVRPEQWDPKADPLPPWLMRDGNSLPADQFPLPGI